MKPFSPTLPAASFTAVVQRQVRDRYEVELAAYDTDAITASVDVLNRDVVRHEIEAEATLPAALTSTFVYEKSLVEAATTYAAFTGTAPVLSRAPARLAVEATRVHPEMVGVVVMVRRATDSHEVEARFLH